MTSCCPFGGLGGIAIHAEVKLVFFHEDLTAFLIDIEKQVTLPVPKIFHALDIHPHLLDTYGVFLYIYPPAKTKQLHL